MAQGDHTISIMVVDGNALCRKFLAAAVAMTPDVELAGVTADAFLALQKIRQKRVDVLLLGFDSAEDFAALSTLQENFPECGIILTGQASDERAHLVLKALQVGALHFLPKPDQLDLPEAVSEFSRQLAPLLRHFTTQRELRHGVTAAPSHPPARAIENIAPADCGHRYPGELTGEFGLIVVAVSTGGPLALLDLIPALPGDLGLPVLIVQHMPPVFTAALAETLAAKSELAVKEAVEGEPVQADTVYLAPGGRHMAVRSRPGTSALKIHLHDGPPVKSCRPAADVLFQAVAEYFAGPVLAVVMTGMGEDGTDGVRRLKQKSCYCLSQSRESCTVYGMPKSVDEAGLSDESVSLQELANRITALVRG